MNVFSGRMELMEEIKNWARYLVSLSPLWELSKLACFDIRPRVSPIRIEVRSKKGQLD